MSKDDILCVLEAASIPVPTTATISQIRKLYAECTVSSEENGATTNNDAAFKNATNNTIMDRVAADVSPANYQTLLRITFGNITIKHSFIILPKHYMNLPFFVLTLLKIPLYKVVAKTKGYNMITKQTHGITIHNIPEVPVMIIGVIKHVPSIVASNYRLNLAVWQFHSSHV